MNLTKELDRIAEAIREKAKELGIVEGMIEIELQAYHPQEAIDNDIPEGHDKLTMTCSLSSGSKLPADSDTHAMPEGINILIGRLLGQYACPNRGTEVLNVHISVSGGNPEQNEQAAWAALPIINEAKQASGPHYLFARDVYEKMDEMGLR